MTWVTRMTKKGLDHIIFRQKFEIFPFFHFWQISQQNVFDDILETKKGCLGSEK